MKKKDSAEPETKRRRKSTRSEQADKDSTASDGNVSVSKPRSGEGSSPSQARKTAKTTTLKAEISTGVRGISVMELESKEADGRDLLEDVESYKRTCIQIEKLVSEIEQLKAEGEKCDSSKIMERRIKATLLTTSLKKLNRLSLIRSKNAKEKTQEMKQKVDALHLDLQNLFYEIMHMKKEIKKCTDFTSKDEEINLVDVEQFYKEAPPEIAKPEVTKSDSHQLMLARLEWELDQRKKLASMKDQLLKEKADIEKDISNQVDMLTSLKPSLNGILKSTLPLQEKLNLNIDSRRVQYEIASYLPKPLYVLFVQVNAFCDTADQGKLSVTIEGDDQAAKALFESGSVAQEEDEESDIDDNNETGDKEENKRRKHRNEKEKARLEEKRRSILRKHPLEIDLGIACQDAVQVSLRFSYLTELRIITVSTTIEIPKETSSSVPIQSTSSLLSADTILRNLFEDKDDGEDSPNPCNQYQLEKLGLQSFSNYIADIGRPYHWVQRLAGLNYLPKSPQESSKNNDVIHSHNIESIVTAIKSRIAGRLSLQSQLSDLEKLIVPEGKCMGRLFPQSTKTKLVQWKCITYSDVLELHFVEDLITADMINENDIFYYAVFRREQEEVKVIISIGVNYPSQPPLFALSFDQKRGKPTNNIAKEIERELNLNFLDLTNIDHPNLLLTNQIHKLAVCFDVFYETEQPGLSQDRLYMRKQRGRDRSRPFVYVQEKGLFVHEVL
ncbi:THO complex subunit 5 homolog isoform X2 [Rhopilema esculentum]|uniref:THO complex subunit 5 homolog isoform X2 n=1 Tax=Rhopilema esculentum TaxID=499914 RepID=UPI0031D735DC